MDEIDELFGSEGGQPQPRRGLIIGLLATGILFSIGGMACTAAPGGMLVLGAWMVVEKEMDRVESGYLPADVRAEVQRLHRFTLLGVATVLSLFALQAWLLADGCYEQLWGSAIQAILVGE